MTKDLRWTMAQYRDSLIGGLNDDAEIRAEIEEMKNAPVGYIKTNCWEKVEDDLFIICEM